MNNILFAPGRAVIVDYQCVRYGPPTFDLMMMLCLCTTREFRDKHEKEVFHHYYSVFTKSLDAPTTQRLKEIGYDEEEFLRWCERARMLSLFYAVGIFPYVLMDPKTAARTFDDPETFRKLTDEDRSEPVIQYARNCQPYLDRQVQSTEEFIERYLLKKVVQSALSWHCTILQCTVDCATVASPGSPPGWLRVGQGRLVSRYGDVTLPAPALSSADRYLFTANTRTNFDSSKFTRSYRRGEAQFGLHCWLLHECHQYKKLSQPAMYAEADFGRQGNFFVFEWYTKSPNEPMDPGIRVFNRLLQVAGL
ncbi:ecdysteroid kinase domain-containing protein [Phthorimaea operculella]|nr:ecdysteroid kinase domain-containing protein [Phthorimaea operculella]